MAEKRVLITGATGFVGANLARRLLREGCQVHLLVRQGHAAWRLQGIRQQVRLHQVELTDRTGLDRLIEQIRPEWIFHLAAYGAYSWQTDVQRMIQTNVADTANLVEACARVGFAAFVNTGSSSEYGAKDHPPAEDEALEPNSHYACTKAAATLLCRYRAQSQNLHLPTLRLYSVYGPYEDPGRLFPALIRKGLQGELPPLVSPDTMRDYVYVEDVCEAYLMAASRPGQAPGAIYNVGTGAQTSMRQLVELARKALGIAVEPHWGSMPARIWDTSTWVADNRQIREALGWEPRTPLAEGFSRTVEWFRQHASLLPGERGD
ncbi:MAG: SDR family NAD(P)-dependent oxidoreductase [Candidatus Latescibacteria bacterium]|nr:SDR family NAD(P)-dependent oxidoreductase [Candidatus Latescibacterota bacterium]